MRYRSNAGFRAVNLRNRLVDAILGYEPVTPREQAHIELATIHLVEHLLERHFARCDKVFHRHNFMAELSQDADGRKALVL